ncbi:MAG: thioredoxin domain-containing protein, partial [Desulfobacterales bacterium]|nr:thioredoxin domain-containing protein [Desulfobacterales bacterium]
HEKSPYLLQHAYNPVDWYPWGDEALEKARKEDKPILLSIGYSTCHWCHVMEEESFMNPDIAELMNTNFVCIKLDREERPDLDKIYMTAVTAITGSGGWPLNVFLTPDLKPFFGGTYFPPTPRQGSLAWPDILRLIANAWKDPSQRDKLQSFSSNLQDGIANALSWTSKDSTINTDVIDKALCAFSSRFDNHLGGFSPAPKFPSPSIQNFLFAYHFYAKTVGKKDKTALLMGDATLRAMANGGIYDQLGGGFHRYSTDAKWHVPHFEKMLYDNAQLLKNYLDAFLITGDRFFGKIARETADYVLRDMTHLDGGFYSAEDADSLPTGKNLKDTDKKKAEGAFYVWEQKEINDLLGDGPGEIFSYRYGVKPEGNAEMDPFNEFKGKNILFNAHSIDEVAKKFNMPNEDVETLILESKLKLLATRSKRPRPHLDDKILTSWNGLMISALSRSYQVLGEKRYLEAARNSAGFLRKNLYDVKEKTLFRRWRQGERKIAGMADDYAFLIQGLIDLYEADFDPGWIEWALKLMDEQIKLFYDAENGGFFMTRKGHDKQIDLRIKEDTDNVIPSAGSVAVSNGLRLARFADSKGYSAIVEQTFKGILARIHSQPDSAPELLVALITSLTQPVEVIIAGDRNTADTRSMLKTVNSVYYPGKIVILVDNDTT